MESQAGRPPRLRHGEVAPAKAPAASASLATIAATLPAGGEDLPAALAPAATTAAPAKVPRVGSESLRKIMVQ